MYLDLFEDINNLNKKNKDPKEYEEYIWKEYGKKTSMLFLDSTSFTKVTRSHGIVHYLSCIVKMREVVGKIFRNNGSISCRFESDNVYAEFETVDEAFTASKQANIELKANKIMLIEDKYFEVCIGIGYGKILKSKHEGVFGDQSNQASKLGEDIAEGGDILLTETAFEKLSEHFKKINNFDKKETLISDIDLIYYKLKKTT